MATSGQMSSGHIVLEFWDECPPSLQSIAEEHPDLLAVVDTKSLSAFDYATQVIVTITPLIVGLLTPVITEHVRAKRELRVKESGVTRSSKDVSLADLLDQLERMAESGGHRQDSAESDH